MRCAQNNAGIAIDFGPGTPREKMERTYATNVFGVVSVIEAFKPLLEAAEFPRLVNVSSVVGSVAEQLSPTGGAFRVNLLVSPLIYGLRTP